jgi:hypothetical protein
MQHRSDKEVGSFARYPVSCGFDKIIVIENLFSSVLPSMTSVLKSARPQLLAKVILISDLARKTFRLPRECDLVLLHSSAFESGLA